MQTARSELFAIASGSSEPLYFPLFERGRLPPPILAQYPLGIRLTVEAVKKEREPLC
jgi:hypothetical protein